MNEERLIQHYLETYSITPFNIIYENSVVSRSYINDIAKCLEVPPISVFADRAIKKVGGAISESWIKRFNQEKL